MSNHLVHIIDDIQKYIILIGKDLCDQEVLDGNNIKNHLKNLKDILNFYSTSPIYNDQPESHFILPTPHINYWDYREHFERTGYFLWLNSEQQARFIDGICADLYMDENFNKQQIDLLANEDDDTPWNASAIGSLAFFKLYGHPKFRETWNIIYDELLSDLKQEYNISENVQKQLNQYVVDHESFPPVPDAVKLTPSKIDRDFSA